MYVIKVGVPMNSIVDHNGCYFSLVFGDVPLPTPHRLDRLVLHTSRCGQLHFAVNLKIHTIGGAPFFTKVLLQSGSIRASPGEVISANQEIDRVTHNLEFD